MKNYDSFLTISCPRPSNTSCENLLHPMLLNHHVDSCEGIAHLVSPTKTNNSLMGS